MDTGLVLMGHRYYDPRVGRFISQDPAGAGGNWYAYAGNSPTNEVDPTGLKGRLDGTLTVPGDWTQQQIEDYVGLNYDDGTYSATQNGKTYTFTINTSQNVGGLIMSVPPGQDFNSMVAAARNYANDINDKEKALRHGVVGVLAAATIAALEAQKASWYWDHFGNGKIGDPKHWNLKFEKFGNFQAGAAADAIGYSLGPYLAGAQLVHMIKHPFGALENLDMTTAGYVNSEMRYGN